MKWKRFGSNQDVLQPKQIKQIYTSIRQGVAKHKFLDALFVVVLKIPTFVRKRVKQSSTHDYCFFLWPFNANICE